MILTFGYGSNMCFGRMRHRVQSLEYAGIGVLDDYRLVLNKVSRDGSAKGNVMSEVGARVYGVVYSLADEHLAALNRAEGLDDGYLLRDDLQVKKVDGSDWAQRVLVYVGDNRYLADDLLPYGWYLRHIVEGALHHGLPPDYVQRLRSFPAVEDPDRMRNRSERMYPCNRQLTAAELTKLSEARRPEPGRLTDYAEHFRLLPPDPSDSIIEFEVDGELPPIKNEALSLFNEEHSNHARVLALLRSAAAAMGSTPTLTGPVSLVVEVHGPDERHGDATNYLAGGRHPGRVAGTT